MASVLVIVSAALSAMSIMCGVAISSRAMVSFSASASEIESVGTPSSVSAIELTFRSASSALRLFATLAAVSEMSNPPTILSSVGWSARNVATETTTGPPDDT